MVKADATWVKVAVDPLCPWSWRVAQWLKEVRGVRSLGVEWALLSLEYLNRERPDHPMMSRFRSNRAAMRLMHMTRGRGGNLKLEELYFALGEAIHERGEDPQEEGVLVEVLGKVGLPQKWALEALQDRDLDQELWGLYAELCTTGAFGVPTIFFGPSMTPYYGPVISKVPRGEQAGELWDHVAGLACHEYFYELKRPR
ncbi:MAG: DsbA family protein [bacterium]